mmetsp:Transcript_3143/g.10303  ORF Transcript_3143/g.10303 Transcript_3143/m.10303 type:complete len:391 (-) Transcript_3143:8-1180(-)
MSRMWQSRRRRRCTRCRKRANQRRARANPRRASLCGALASPKMLRATAEVSAAAAAVQAAAATVAVATVEGWTPAHCSLCSRPTRRATRPPSRTCWRRCCPRAGRRRRPSPCPSPTPWRGCGAATWRRESCWRRLRRRRRRGRLAPQAKDLSDAEQPAHRRHLAERLLGAVDGVADLPLRALVRDSKVVQRLGVVHVGGDEGVEEEQRLGEDADVLARPGDDCDVSHEEEPALRRVQEAAVCLEEATRKRQLAAREHESKQAEVAAQHHLGRPKGDARRDQRDWRGDDDPKAAPHVDPSRHLGRAVDEGLVSLHRAPNLPRLARLPGERRASGTRSGAWDAGDGGPRRTSPTLGVILLRSRLRQRDEDEQAAAHRRVSGAATLPRAPPAI